MHCSKCWNVYKHNYILDIVLRALHNLFSSVFYHKPMKHMYFFFFSFPSFLPSALPPSLFLSCLFRATPAAYRGSQPKGQIRALVAGLHHSPSNARSEPHMQPTSQLSAMLSHDGNSRVFFCFLFLSFF